VKQVVAIGAKRTEGELAQPQAIEEFVGPEERLLLLIKEAVGRSAGEDVRPMY
jgi:hypothetical protein